MANAKQIYSFIESIGPIIQREAKARGYKVASPIIAQACIESAFGTSSLGYKYFNFFGMKCGSAWKGKSVNLKTKEEYTVGTLTTIRDNFRAYDSIEEGVRGYFDFISTKRYSNLKTATSPQEYLERIKADGYATSSSYVSTNMKTVTAYDLTRFDTLLAVPERDNVNPYPVPVRTLKRTYRGEDVKWLQWELAKRGYIVGTIDGIFGNKTYSAVCSFQKSSNGKLAVDGIVGKCTLAVLNT